VTIAAGFLHSEGVLLCSDTLMTSDAGCRYGSKIRLSPFKDGTLGVAFSGPVKFAESTLQQCERDVKIHSGPDREHADIADVVRNRWYSEYTAHKPNNVCEPSIIVAIWSVVDGIGLYSSSGAAIAESTSGYECIGFGEPLANHLIGEYHPYVSSEEAVWLATAVLCRVKDSIRAWCGGNTLLLHLLKDGRYKTIGDRRTKLLEKYANEYDQTVRALAGSFYDLAGDLRFNTALSESANQIARLRQRWKSEQAAIECDFPPRELTEALMKLPREFRKVKRSIQVVSKRNR
jgi:hypothetical protein